MFQVDGVRQPRILNLVSQSRRRKSPISTHPDSPPPSGYTHTWERLRGSTLRKIWSWSPLSLAGAATSIIFCRDKHVFATTKHVFCRDKSMFVATKRSSNMILSRQASFVCRDRHIFVATKMILVAASASDSPPLRQSVVVCNFALATAATTLMPSCMGTCPYHGQHQWRGQGGTCYVDNSWSFMIYHLAQACALVEMAEGKVKRHRLQDTGTRSLVAQSVSNLSRKPKMLSTIGCGHHRDG